MHSALYSNRPRDASPSYDYEDRGPYEYDNNSSGSSNNSSGNNSFKYNRNSGGRGSYSSNRNSYNRDDEYGHIGDDEPY